MSFSVRGGRFTRTPGQIDVTSRTKRPRSQNLASNAILALLQHEQTDHRHYRPERYRRPDVVDEIRRSSRRPNIFFAFRAADGELEDVARLQMQSVFRSPVRIAGPWVSMRIATDGRASSASLRIRGTIRRTQSCSGVTHIQPENVRAFARSICESLPAFPSPVPVCR